MSKEIVKIANEIIKRKKEIDEIESFLFVLDSCKRTNARESNIHAIIKTKTTKEFRIFASRWFGYDTHKHEIEVPESILYDLEMVLHDKLNGLKKDIERISISYE